MMQAALFQLRAATEKIEDPFIRSQLRLKRLYPGSIVKGAVRTILVPAPATARVGGTPLRDVELLRWCRELIGAVLLDAPAAPANAG